jgi:N-acetylglucosaminyl-diphospho-decaprenol L-rhamnosyltransferase
MAVPEVTYCVVSTEQRELLIRGLDAIARERESVPFATEVVVLDNASRDGSAEAARAHPAVDEVIALDRRQGKAAGDSQLLQRTRGPYALLLNEDSELRPGATAALHAALEAHPRAGSAGAQLLDASGRPQPCAWRFPSARTALAGALFLHRWLTVQSGGPADAPPREVDWVQSSAMLVRREAAAAIGYFDPAFFVYGDEVDFARRLADAGWATLYVPGARAVHAEGLRTGSVPTRRIVELCRNRDRYLRKHHGRATALALRPLIAWPYAVRAALALALPGHDPLRYWTHVVATLRPGRGEGIREAAEAFNRSLAQDVPRAPSKGQ